MHLSPFDGRPQENELLYVGFNQDQGQKTFSLAKQKKRMRRTIFLRVIIFTTKIHIFYQKSVYSTKIWISATNPDFPPKIRILRQKTPEIARKRPKSPEISKILRHEIAAASKLDGNFYEDISESSLIFTELVGPILLMIRDQNFTNNDF